MFRTARTRHLPVPVQEADRLPGLFLKTLPKIEPEIDTALNYSTSLDPRPLARAPELNTKNILINIPVIIKRNK